MLAVLLASLFGAALQDADVPLFAGRDIPVPRRIEGQDPSYPSLARQAGVQGWVILQITLAPSGRPTDLRVLRGAPTLSAPAIEAAKTWRFEPMTQDTMPRKRIVNEIVSFFAAGAETGFIEAARDPSWEKEWRLRSLTRLLEADPKRLKSHRKALEALAKDRDQDIAAAATEVLARLNPVR
jgi:TonB family protein